MSTMSKILQNEELHPSLVKYFTHTTQYQGQSQITKGTSNKHSKARRINGDQFLHSFMPKAMRNLRAQVPYN